MQLRHKPSQYKDLVRSLKTDCKKCSGRYLAEAAALIPAKNLADDMDARIAEYRNMTALSPQEILQIDLEEYRTRVNCILKKA